MFVGMDFNFAVTGFNTMIENLPLGSVDPTTLTVAALGLSAIAAGALYWNQSEKAQPTLPDTVLLLSPNEEGETLPPATAEEPSPSDLIEQPASLEIEQPVPQKVEQPVPPEIKLAASIENDSKKSILEIVMIASAATIFSIYWVVKAIQNWDLNFPKKW